MSTSSITQSSSGSCPREYWAAESKRLGSDWISIATTVAAVLRNLAGPSS
jgi:hypothetical protein